MIYLPNEIINIIFSFVERPQTNKLMKYIIEDCYEEDYDPYYSETIYDDYRYHYTFKEWYFLYRKMWILKEKNIYKKTPYPTFTGTDKTLYLL
jgi:hypothetical protein